MIIVYGICSLYSELFKGGWDGTLYDESFRDGIIGLWFDELVTHDLIESNPLSCSFDRPHTLNT